jgi:periplasmic protein TonB
MLIGVRIGVSKTSARRRSHPPGADGCRHCFTEFASDSVTAAALSFRDEQSDPLVRRALKLGAVLGLHVALLAWVMHAPFHQPPEPAPTLMDVRMIEVPPPRPALLETPRPVVKPPQPLPPATRPVVRRPQPSTPPPVLAASPASTPSSAAFAVAPQPAVQPKEASVALPATPAPVAMAAARFDADYLQNPAPAYPAMSRRLREEGKVLLLVRVTARGDAEQVQLKQGSGFSRLDEAAIKTVQQWRFVPARQGADAVAASVVVPIIFRLDS